MVDVPDSDANKIIEQAAEKYKREQKFEAIKAKAHKMATQLKSHEYNLEDFMALAVVTLMNAANVVPQIEGTVKWLTNFWVDAAIQMDEQDGSNNGLLSQQKEQIDSRIIGS